ncbi:MAG: SCO family protein [Pseudomonadales bacterium]|nr:SCO family protein [Pseudomonadales bacterium]
MTTQNGEEISLSVFEGHPVLVSMFYASCPHVCPTTIANIKRIESRLSAEQRKELRVLMVSVDAERDTPQKLRELVDRHQVDTDRWTFATPIAGGVRKVAAVLGVKYRKLPDGEFNHSTMIGLLDANGRVQAQTARIANPEEKFVKAVQEHL